MRIEMKNRANGLSLALAGMMALGGPGVQAAIHKAPSAEPEMTVAEEEINEPSDTGGREVQKDIIIKSIEPSLDRKGRKEVSWLGVSTEESSEALAAQLGLEPGVGLVATFIAEDSPAAKAGLRKNDLLVEFEGQSLVHPAQLRKLVQARKEGDSVKIGYYRAGKKETASVTLGKTTVGMGLFEGEGGWLGRPGNPLQLQLGELQEQFRDLPIRDMMREQMKHLRQSMGELKIDQEKVQEEMKRSLREARRAVDEALRQATNARSALDPVKRRLREVESADVLVDDNANVTVRSTGKVKSTVKSDDFGTIVIVASPKPRLTAHDKAGKLLFDGEIATPEQRSKVPAEVWERAEPLLDKMGELPEREGERRGERE
jgi:membrane-associated protease RseP (regulator of RpoE activity)